MRAVLAAALVVIVPSVAAADELWIAHAPIEADGVDVGVVASVRAQVAGVDGDRIAFRHQGDLVTLDATLDLARAGTHVQVGFARETRVATDTDFVIRAQAGTYAPLYSLDAEEYEIALPPGLPAWSARVERPSRGELPSFTPREPFDTELDPLTVEEPRMIARCPGAELRPTRTSDDRWELPTSSTLVAIGPARGGLIRVRAIQRHGFSVDGFTEVPTCETTYFSSGGYGGSTGRIVDVMGDPRRAILAPGTGLLAVEGGSAPFATLRIGAQAFGFHEGQWVLYLCSGDGSILLDVAGFVAPTSEPATSTRTSCCFEAGTTSIPEDHWPARPLPP